jgi:AcrR family transcriptional regulator
MSEPERRTQKERSEASTARLLEAAGQLIIEGGYNGMTLAAVGERSGYSRGLVTARFGSKDKLLERLIETITANWGYKNILSLYPGQSGRERIMIFLRATHERARHEPQALRLLYALMFEALGPVPELRARFVQFHRDQQRGLAQSVRLGQRDGSVAPGLSPDREAELIVAGVRGVAYQWCLDPDEHDHVRALAYLLETTEGRLAPDTGTASAGNGKTAPASRRRREART